MPEIREVSGTAFVVAEFRAEENLEASPLYRDSIVELFLNDDSRLAADRVAARFAACRDLVRIRTKYLDDMLERSIGAGVRQVVILGAGLDTRAVRKPARGVAYFEIDDAATLALKRARYEEFGIDAGVTFIPGDYVADGLIDLLRWNNFNFDAPTYIIWEGNTMYLSLDSIISVLADLVRYVKRFRLSFDYMADAVISKTTGDRSITNLVESFEAMGAPWQSGIGDVRSLARQIGLKTLEDVRTAELFQSYWVGRPMTSEIFQFYSLCTLER